MVGIKANRRGQTDDLPGGMCAKFGRIHAIIGAVVQRVFVDLEHVQETIGVKTRSLPIIIFNVGITADGSGDIAV